MKRENESALAQLEDQLRRERDRWAVERGHFEAEAEQVRRIAAERAEAEVERVKEEEDAKRRLLAKKHAVSKKTTPSLSSNE